MNVGNEEPAVKRSIFLTALSIWVTLLAGLLTWITISDARVVSDYRDEPGLGLVLNQHSVTVICLAPLESLSVLLSLKIGIKAALASDCLLAALHWVCAVILWKSSRLRTQVMAVVTGLYSLHFLAAFPVLLEFRSESYWPGTRSLATNLGLLSLLIYGSATYLLLYHLRDRRVKSPPSTGPA